MNTTKAPVIHYGVTEMTPSGDNIDLHKEEILLKGYTIVPNVLTPEQIKIAKEKIEIIYAKQVAEVGEEVMEKLGDKDITRSPLVYDDFFLYNFTVNPTVIAILKKIFGNNFILREQNAIINRAKSQNYQLRWHRDLMYQHFTYSRPFTVSALFCLADFNEKNGGTWILPASHKTEAFPSEEYIRANEVCANAPAGSAIVFDAMLYHRAGQNVSDNDRIGVNNMYVAPYMKQAISFPSQLKGKYSDDPFLSFLLGYDTDTDADVKSWRMRRYNRSAKK